MAINIRNSMRQEDAHYEGPKLRWSDVIRKYTKEKGVNIEQATSLIKLLSCNCRYVNWITK